MINGKKGLGIHFNQNSIAGYNINHMCLTKYESEHLKCASNY